MEQRDRALAQSTSRNNELQRSYDALARELTAVREALQSSISSVESKDHTIASLTEELEKSKGESVGNAKKLRSTLEDVKKLQNDVFTLKSQLADLKGRWDEQSRELTDLRDELHKSTLFGESKDESIVSLTKELEERSGAGADKGKQIAIFKERVKELTAELATAASKFIASQMRYNKQSRELTAVQDELKNAVSSIESKDHTITSSAAKIEQLEADAAQKAELVSESD